MSFKIYVVDIFSLAGLSSWKYGFCIAQDVTKVQKVDAQLNSGIQGCVWLLAGAFGVLLKNIMYLYMSENKSPQAEEKKKVEHIKIYHWRGHIIVNKI